MTVYVKVENANYADAFANGEITISTKAVTITVTGNTNTVTFTGATPKEWYHDGVHFCLENGLMVGYKDMTFRTGTGTSRAMIAMMLWRLNGSPIVDYDMDFEDVKEGAWYTEAIRWAKSKGVVAGYGNGKYGPDDILTREQLVMILYQYAEYKRNDMSAGETTSIGSYGDADKVARYANTAMKWACGSGVVTGERFRGPLFYPKRGRAHGRENRLITLWVSAA